MVSNIINKNWMNYSVVIHRLFGNNNNKYMINEKNWRNLHQIKLLHVVRLQSRNVKESIFLQINKENGSYTKFWHQKRVCIQLWRLCKKPQEAWNKKKRNIQEWLIFEIISFYVSISLTRFCHVSIFSVEMRYTFISIKNILHLYGI